MMRKYCQLLLTLCLFFSFQNGYSQFIVYPATSHMHIELAPGLYNPDSGMADLIPPYPSFLYIQDYIGELLSVEDDIEIVTPSQSVFGAYRYGGNPNLFPLHCGRFFFDSISDIGIDSGIILNSGNVYYSALVWPVPSNPFQSLGPGSFPGVCWPANFHSSGLNYGGNITIAVVPFTDSADRDAQYPELVALNNGDSIWDANVLDFDFIPKGPYIKLEYVFGSEEYGQACGLPTDVMGIFLSGPGY